MGQEKRRTKVGEIDLNCVRVYCRIRPASKLEISHQGIPCVSTEDNCVHVKTADSSHTFTFDHVFNEDDNQETVFNFLAKPVVDDVMAGYNATIFAYGQTSSGKTYTMEGPSICDPELSGIIPRTAFCLFSSVMLADENLEFIVKVGFIEIYMERIRDLLDPYRTKTNLQVRRDSRKGIYVADATEISVTNPTELLSVMSDGRDNRAVAATGMNEGSSRSHSVFMITLNQRNLETQASKNGKLFLVDLAGSEMVRKTGASGQQLEEAKTINKSLSALGQVINALTDPHASHIPYRDSKLTRVLEDSIGGNSRTGLIINISPSSFNASETVSTLRFGSRAKNIKNKAIINEEISVQEYKIMLQNMEKLLASRETYIIKLETRLSEKKIGQKEETIIGRKDRRISFEEENALDPTAICLDLNDRNESHKTAAEVIEKLQVRLLEIEEQLSEERAETSRRAEEIVAMKSLLDQREAEWREKGKIFEKDINSAKQEYEEKFLNLGLQFTEEKEDLMMQLEQLTHKKSEISIHADTLEQEISRLRDEVGILDKGAESLRSESKTGVSQKHHESTSHIISISTSEVDLASMKKELCDVKECMKQLVDDHMREKTSLLNEIDEKESKILELEAEVDKIRSNGVVPSAASGMSAHERSHLRSVQQKLEQLVAVHRQLLKKYVSLELELGEAKKKLALRDDRIKQLEGNTRMLAGNMRAQAERHVKELTGLRDQISQLREDESKKSIAEDDNRHFDRKNEGMIRPIRGGGKKQCVNSQLSYSKSNTEKSSTSKFLSRLFMGNDS